MWPLLQLDNGTGACGGVTSCQYAAWGLAPQRHDLLRVSLAEGEDNWSIHREAPPFVEQSTEQEILVTGIKVRSAPVLYQPVEQLQIELTWRAALCLLACWEKGT